MPVILTYVREDRSGCPRCCCCCRNTATHVSEDVLKQINDINNNNINTAALCTPEEQRAEQAEGYAPCLTEDTTLPHTLRCFNERTRTNYDITVLNTIYKTEGCDVDDEEERQGNVAGMLVAVQREAMTETSMSYTQAPQHMQSSEKMCTQPFMPLSASVTWADVLRAVLHEMCACDAQVYEQWHKACAYYCHTNNNAEDEWYDEGEETAAMLMACNVRFVLLPAEAQTWLRTCHTEAQLMQSEQQQQQRQLPLTAPLYTRAARMTFFDDDIERCFAYYATSCLFVYFTLPPCETERCLTWDDMADTGVCEGEEAAYSGGGNGVCEAEATPADRTLCVTTPPAPLKKAKTCTTTRTETMPTCEAVRISVSKRGGQDATQTPGQPHFTSQPRRLLTELEHAALMHTQHTTMKKKMKENEQCLLWSRVALMRQLRGYHAAALHWQEDIAQDSLDMCEDVDVVLSKLQDMLRSTTTSTTDTDCNLSDPQGCNGQKEERTRKAAQLTCPAYALGAWQLSLLELYCDLLLESAAAWPTTRAVRRERLLRCAAVGQKVLCIIERLARRTRHAEQQQQQQQQMQKTMSKSNSFPYDLLLLLLACLRLRTLRHLALLLSASLGQQTHNGTTIRESKQRACLLQIRRDALYTTQGLLQQLQPLYESDAYTPSSSSAFLLLQSALPALRPTLRLAALSLTEMAVYLAIDTTQDAKGKSKNKKKKMQKTQPATVCEPLEMIEAALHVFHLCEEAGATEMKAAAAESGAAPQCVVEALRVMQTRCPASCQPAIAALLLHLLQAHKSTEKDVIQSKTAHTTNKLSDDMPPCIGYTLRTVWSTAAADRLFIRAMLLHDALRDANKKKEDDEV